MSVGIDGSNIRAGGGLTHLSQLIAHAAPEEAGIGSVHVWANAATLSQIPGPRWLRKHRVTALDGGLLRRSVWRETRLCHSVADAGCNVLFAPGTLLPRGVNIPTVAMSQNMLPFEPEEAARFGRGSAMWWKCQLLRHAQTRAFSKASGIVFLTRYAREHVMQEVGPAPGAVSIIPHGLEDRFRRQPRAPRPLAQCTADRPFRLLYVSVVNVYKHQERVVRAVAQLRAEGMAVRLDLVGIASPAMRERLWREIARVDPDGNFINHHGYVPFAELDRTYSDADAFIFASSCENLPNIVVEAMGAGLPIASSDRGPMPEVLGDAAVYFNPLDVEDMAGAIRRLVRDPGLRRCLAERAFARAQRYSWETCSRDTFSFLADCARRGR